MSSYLKFKISDYIYFLLMFFLPISLLMGNIFLAMLLLSVLVQKRKKRIKKTIILALAFFFLFNLMNGLIATSFVIEQNNYIKILPLLLLPFCLSTLDSGIKTKGLIFLFFGVLFIQIHSIIGIIDYYYFTEGKKYALKNYSRINQILHYERPYLGYFSVINIIISYFIFKNHKQRKLSILTGVFSLALIITISARLAMISSLLIGLIIIFVELNKTRRIIAFSGIAVLVLFFFMNDGSLKQRFFNINRDARVVIWKGAIHSFARAEKRLFGSGSQVDTRNKLLEYYKKNETFESIDEKNRFITKNYNTHNQYLNELLRGGIIGMLIFLLPQLYILYIVLIKEHTIVGLLLLISILCFCLVENILDRQVGVYLYAILLSLSTLKENESIDHD